MELNNFGRNSTPFVEDTYQIIDKIGKGTFGEVFKARDIKTKQLVALKRLLTPAPDVIDPYGFPITAMREIRILQALKHEHIVDLLGLVRSRSKRNTNHACTTYLVLEFCEHDLAGLLCNNRVQLKYGHIKTMMKQLLEGVYFMHVCKIMHRDLKTANILVTKKGVLKLADFGLSRSLLNRKTNKPIYGYTPQGEFEREIARAALQPEGPIRYTRGVCTLWYRAPELLLGERCYGLPVDMWGVGCIMAEMWTRKPIMRGTNDESQLKLTIDLCGSINTDTWPGVNCMDLSKLPKPPQENKRKITERLMPVIKCPHALDLLDKLLTLDPSKRIDSDTALNHDFFWTEHASLDLGELLTKHPDSMFEHFVRSQQNVAAQQQPAQLQPDDEFHTRIY